MSLETTYNKTISQGWGGERRRRKKREGGRGEGGKECGVVGVQPPGVRRSPELGAQTTPLRCQVQIDLTRRMVASASSLCSHAMLVCTTGMRCMPGKGPSAINPEHALLCAVSGETALSSGSTIPRKIPCAEHVWA